MEQLDLALMGMITEAGIVPHSLIVRAKTYREAVRMCWAYRRIQRMTKRKLAEQVEGMYPSHVSDYLCASDTTPKGKARRELPAKLIKGFQAACGNKFITQWQAYEEGITVLESVIAERKAA